MKKSLGQSAKKGGMREPINIENLATGCIPKFEEGV